MVAGYHLIWTLYGFWLPNDPRGSTSLELRVAIIQSLGDIHYGRKLQQPSSAELRLFLSQAHDALAHPVMILDEAGIELVGKVLGEEIGARGYTCYACAVMPDHVHLLIRRHRDKAEAMIEVFQDKSRAALIEAGHRQPTHPVWTKGGWKGFLNTPADFVRDVSYIGNNPTKIGRPAQHWEFVAPYDGWLPRYRG